MMGNKRQLIEGSGFFIKLFLFSRLTSLVSTTKKRNGMGSIGRMKWRK
jgi:hypothetical protein